MIYLHHQQSGIFWGHILDLQPPRGFSITCSYITHVPSSPRALVTLLDGTSISQQSPTPRAHSPSQLLGKRSALPVFLAPSLEFTA